MSEVQLEVRSNSKASSLGSGEILRMASGVISGGHTPTPTWTEGTPSFTESSSSGELGMAIDFIGLASEPVCMFVSSLLLKGFQDRRKWTKRLAALSAPARESSTKKHPRTFIRIMKWWVPLAFRERFSAGKIIKNKQTNKNKKKNGPASERAKNNETYCTFQSNGSSLRISIRLPEPPKLVFPPKTFKA